MEFENETRIVTQSQVSGDNEIEYSLRPKLLDDYIGQTKVKENLKVFMEAAKNTTLPDVPDYKKVLDFVKAVNARELSSQKIVEEIFEDR